MIRKLHKNDIDEVAKIWLYSNLEAHGFIPTRYWEDNFASVKESLGQAEVYVYEDEKGKRDGNRIAGFLGLSDDYIAGIFVRSERRSEGIGKRLLDHAKGVKEKLSLKVYQKNERAVSFYRREDFVILCEGEDEDTGEKEFSMGWERKAAEK